MANRFLSALASVGQAVKKAYDFAINGEVMGVMAQVGSIGGQCCRGLGLLFALRNIYLTVKDPNSTPAQKIFPLISYSLLGAFSVVATTLVATLAIAALQPLFIVGGIMGVVRDTTYYWQERTQRNQLRKQLTPEKTNGIIDDAHLTQRLNQDFKKFIAKEKVTQQQIQDMYVRLANHFINTQQQKYQALAGKIKRLKDGTLNDKERAALAKEIKSLKKELKALFVRENKAIFELVEKKQLLYHLNKSVKVRLKNIGISAGVAVLSTIGGALTMVAAATPAAPAVPAIATGFVASGVALATVGAVSSLRMDVKEWQRVGKATAPKKAVVEAMVPHVKPKTKEKTAQPKQAAKLNAKKPKPIIPAAKAGKTGDAEFDARMNQALQAAIEMRKRKAITHAYTPVAPTLTQSAPDRKTTQNRKIEPK